MNHRVIARLDIKGPNLIKGIHLEGLRVIGDPQAYAKQYYEGGIDEIIYIDSVASLYDRNNLSDVVKNAAREVFIPLTVGGGIRSLKDVDNLLNCGADKVALNTAALKNPSLITDISKTFGSQCVVINIEAKRQPNGKFEAYIDNGRERTGQDVLTWALRAQDLGAGEILLTSVDREGTQKGFDKDITKSVATALDIPVIASGGMGTLDHFCDVITHGKADAVAIAHVLHYKKYTVADIKDHALSHNIDVRR